MSENNDDALLLRLGRGGLGTDEANQAKLDLFEYNVFPYKNLLGEMNKEKSDFARLLYRLLFFLGFKWKKDRKDRNDKALKDDNGNVLYEIIEDAEEIVDKVQKSIGDKRLRIRAMSDGIIDEINGQLVRHFDNDKCWWLRCSETAQRWTKVTVGELNNPWQGNVVAVPKSNELLSDLLEKKLPQLPGGSGRNFVFINETEKSTNIRKNFCFCSFRTSSSSGPARKTPGCRSTGVQ